MFVAVMKVDGNRVAKYAEFQTRTAADAHRSQYLVTYPASFVVDGSAIPGPIQQWWIVGQTVTVVAIPDPDGDRMRDDQTQRSAILADSFVPQFIAMTPAQVSAYINTNVTSLATAKTLIEKLSLMVLLLARREFR